MAGGRAPDPTPDLPPGLRVRGGADRHGAAGAVAQADETSWPQYIEGQANGKHPPASGGKPLHWLWVCLTADTVRMRILPTRNAAAAGELLGNLGQELHTWVIVVCDR